MRIATTPSSPPPIAIPTALTHDRAFRRLLTAWLNAHARFSVCNKRLNWKTPQAYRIEKARRKEKWLCVARILDIEHTLLKWLAASTHHPDLWTSTKHGTLSRRSNLRNAYYQQRMIENRTRGDARKSVIHTRTVIVAQIRLLDRQWMTALLTAIYPTAVCPARLPLHPRELLPRKIATAAKHLVNELGRPDIEPAKPRRLTVVVPRLRKLA